MERSGIPVQCSALFAFLCQLSCNIDPVTDVRFVSFIKVDFVLLCGHYFACFFAVFVLVKEVIESRLHGGGKPAR